jgi:hypothetical protein
LEAPQAPEAEPGRLDVFEDFLKKLGGEKGEDKPKEE